MKHVDVLIVGAGISGIGVACHLTMKCPDRSFQILENRDQIGGTWDLFKYPGIRSDSDMYTFGYSFKPWTNPKEIAPAEDIRAYLEETVEEYRLADRMQFGCSVKKLNWSSESRLWTAEYFNAQTGQDESMTANFVMNCTGYYNYEQAHQPELPEQEKFAGAIIHPQFWPEDLDYSGKNVVVVGSGATAVTIVPSMADKAAHVTMLQRTPSFVVSRPEQDPLVVRLRNWLPEYLVWRIKRTKNLALSTLFYAKCRKKPDTVRDMLVNMADAQLQGEVDAKVHFNAPYNPWDQRLCLVPGGDLFAALREKKAEVVTDQIAGFEANAIRLQSGRQIKADIVVSATGIQLRFLGGMQTFVDGRKVDTGTLVNYRGTLFGGLPNFGSVFGYANASWTLKADLSADYFCRLLNYMRRKNLVVATPRLPEASMELNPMLNLSSGYIKRSAAQFPKFGDSSPWKNFEYYVRDFFEIRFGRLHNGRLDLR